MAPLPTVSWLKISFSSSFAVVVQSGLFLPSDDRNDDDDDDDDDTDEDGAPCCVAIPPVVVFPGALAFLVAEAIAAAAAFCLLRKELALACSPIVDDGFGFGRASVRHCKLCGNSSRA